VTTNQIAILQNNVHKSKERTNSILNDPDTKHYAILMLQEQYWSAYTKSSPIHHAWTLIESTAINDNGQPRTAIYVNNNLFPASKITPMALPINDVTAITLNTLHEKPSLFVNIYNPCDKNILSELQEHLRKNFNTRDYNMIIIGGDFNTHHPLWNPNGYMRHDDEANTLVDMMAELGMNLLLPSGTITYPSAGTAIDLVWGNNEAVNKTITCRIAEEHDHGSDHLPIEIKVALQIEETKSKPSYNYTKTDWKELKSKVKWYLLNVIPTDEQSIRCADVDKFAEELVKAISKAVEDTTPRKRPSQHSKRWWTEELTKMRRESNRLRNIYQRTRHDVDKAAWRIKANQYMHEIAQAKTKKWKEFVDKADRKSIWQVKKYIDNTPTSTFIPTINGNATTHEQKATAFQKAFFPKPPCADLTDIPPAIHLQEVPFETQITTRQIHEAVNKLAPDKAPGPDEIANKVLKNTLPIIECHLQVLMQASINLGHFPKCFKNTDTIVLRKPGKPDYTQAKAYWPSALENTVGKILESIMADIMSYLT